MQEKEKSSSLLLFKLHVSNCATYKDKEVSMSFSLIH